MYVWVLCNLPVLVAGLQRLRRQPRKRSVVNEEGQLPSVSIIVPVKDEERVVKRILTALLELDYPVAKKEIIVVDDASTDCTASICRGYARRHPSQIRYFRRITSKGKPSALNYALCHVTGDLVATFDADNVPEPDVLRVAAQRFADSGVAAVQGRLGSINANENMLTQCVSHEMALFYDAYLRGKAALHLFVPLAGTCQFIRREVLRDVGGWQAGSLSEDMELSVRLVDQGHRIAYAPEIRTWQEYPANLLGFLKQRIRWFRGCMQVALTYGKLLTKFNRQCFDAEIMLFGPYMFILCLFAFLMAALTGFVSFSPGFALVVQGTALLIVGGLLFSGGAMFLVTKPRRLAHVLWVPFLCFYVVLQSCVSLFALVQIALNRPRTWTKTVKTGRVTWCGERPYVARDR